MKTVAIAGASGYIGKFLVKELVSKGTSRINILSRSECAGLGELSRHESVHIMRGDLELPQSIRQFLEPGCTVVNLVYLWNASEFENLSAIRNLSQACRAAEVKRLIHCSTAAVTGRIEDDIVTEETPCRPVSQYGITKLKIEEAVRAAGTDCYETAILRPTVVFGPNGNPLRKLVDDLASGNRLRNHIKSCLFNKRRMNLVPVRTVAAAIDFLVGYEHLAPGEVFNVSEDDNPANNFADVESFLISALGLPSYSVPRVAVPLDVLSFLLTRMGRNNVNPRCSYSSEKLLGKGFIRPTSLDAALAEYAEWYKSVGYGT